MTDGIDEFRVLPENVNYYLDLGFKLMRYCKYCDSYYLPKYNKRKRVCCNKKECKYEHLKTYPVDKEYHKSYREKKRSKRKRYCKSCKKEIGRYLQICKSCKRKKLYDWQKKYAKTYEPPLNYRIADGIRSRIRQAIKNYKKRYKTEKLIGCTFEYFKEHIAKQFKPGMSWDNHAFDTWHIDHIIPVSHFDLSNPEEQKKAFHYTNCQPLWAKDNLKKGNRYVG